MEGRIKEQQLGLFADRTSSKMIQANQLRLYFSARAYLIVHTLRRVGLAGEEASAGAELEPATETAEGRRSGPGHQEQGLVVLFRELPVCSVCEEGSGASASPPTSLLTKRSRLEADTLGVRRMVTVLEPALASETPLKRAGGGSNAPRDRWIMAYFVSFEAERILSQYLCHNTSDLRLKGPIIVSLVRNTG